MEFIPLAGWRRPAEENQGKRGRAQAGSQDLYKDSSEKEWTIRFYFIGFRLGKNISYHRKNMVIWIWNYYN